MQAAVHGCCHFCAGWGWQALLGSQVRAFAASRRIAVFCCSVSSNFCLPWPCSLRPLCHITPLHRTSVNVPSARSRLQHIAQTSPSRQAPSVLSMTPSPVCHLAGQTVRGSCWSQHMLLWPLYLLSLSSSLFCVGQVRAAGAGKLAGAVKSSLGFRLKFRCLQSGMQEGVLLCEECPTASLSVWCRCSLPAVDAYYAGSSSSLSIPDVKVPLLVLQVRAATSAQHSTTKECACQFQAALGVAVAGATCRISHSLVALCLYVSMQCVVCVFACVYVSHKYASCVLCSVYNLQAADDPIAPQEAIPFKALEANPNCLLVLTPTGGHLGWCGGRDGVTGEQPAAARISKRRPAACAAAASGSVSVVPYELVAASPVAVFQSACFSLLTFRCSLE